MLDYSHLFHVLIPEITLDYFERAKNGENTDLERYAKLRLLKDLGQKVYGIDAIVRVYQIRENKKYNNFSIMVTDYEGFGLPLSLWDNQIEVVREMELLEGDILFIKNTNTRIGKSGALSINAGSKSEIVRITEMINTDAFAQGEAEIAKPKDGSIAEIVPSDSSVSIEGRITQINHSKPVDVGKSGNTLASIIVDDGTSIEVQFWGTHSAKVDNFQLEEKIRLNNLKVRFRERIILSFIRYSEMVYKPGVVIEERGPEKTPAKIGKQLFEPLPEPLFPESSDIPVHLNGKRVAKNGIVTSIPFHFDQRLVFTIRDIKNNPYQVFCNPDVDIRIDDEIQLINIVAEETEGRDHSYNLIIDENSTVNKIRI